MRRILWSVLAIVPVVVFAQDESSFRCTQDGLVRRVEIVYETEAPVPCAVHYYKDTEAPGEDQVLWNAQNEAGYCEARTRELVERLESGGFECAAVAAGRQTAGAGD